jgi:hypothetical protein
MDPKRELLRHTVATVAYRGGKAVRGATAEFGNFKGPEQLRSPVELLAHLGDLYDWALTMAKGAQEWQPAAPLPWDAEVARFFETLKAFDRYLESDEPLHMAAEKLFQGPVADSLTHIGQLIMLRRLAAQPVRSENYARADILAGRVGLDQTPPRREFD